MTTSRFSVAVSRPTPAAKFTRTREGEVRTQRAAQRFIYIRHTLPHSSAAPRLRWRRGSGRLSSACARSSSGSRSSSFSRAATTSCIRQFQKPVLRKNRFEIFESGATGAHRLARLLCLELGHLRVVKVNEFQLRRPLHTGERVSRRRGEGRCGGKIGVRMRCRSHCAPKRVESGDD